MTSGQFATSLINMASKLETQMLGRTCGFMNGYYRNAIGSQSMFRSLDPAETNTGPISAPGEPTSGNLRLSGRLRSDNPGESLAGGHHGPFDDGIQEHQVGLVLHGEFESTVP